MTDFLRSDRVRVLINAIHAKSGGGVTYLRNLLPQLAADPDLELHLVLTPSQFDLFNPVDERVKLHLVCFKESFWRTMLWEQFVLPFLSREMSTDIIFSPANYGPLLNCNQVIVLQNSLAVGAAERRWSKRLYWAVLSVMTGLSLVRSRATISVSNYVAQSSPRLFRRLGKDVTVIHHGVDTQFHPPVVPREDFLLAVGDIYVQKNLHTLMQAIALVRRQMPGVQLKVAGRRLDEHYSAEVEALVSELGIADNIEFLGSRTSAEVADLYRRCRLFVFPSVEESFGMPVLEALASGCTVACSNAAAMPEVAGDAVQYFSPHDPEQMAQVILALYADTERQRQLGVAGVERARQFTWENAACQTAQLIKIAAGKK